MEAGDAPAAEDEEAKALGDSAQVLQMIVPGVATRPLGTWRVHSVITASSLVTWQRTALIRRSRRPPGAAPVELVWVQPPPEPPPAETGERKEEERVAQRMRKGCKGARRTPMPAMLISPKKGNA